MKESEHANDMERGRGLSMSTSTKSYTVIGVYPDDLWDEGAAGASYAEQVKAVDVQHAIRLAEALDSPNRAENAIVISVLEGWHTEAGDVNDYNG